jgi:hypothetical protein
MKVMKSIVVLVFFSALTFVNAQEKKDLTNDEYKQLWKSTVAKDSSLLKENSALQSDINKLRETSAKTVVPNCDEELLKLVSATPSDVDNFRKAVSELEGKIRRKEGPKADRQKDLDALKANKIAALPEFFNKVFNQLQSGLNSWVEEVAASKDINYTVVKGDCLWFIAKKKEHYGNGFAWPKIYQANKDQIKNPNLIYPKQTFKIPPLTEDEVAKYAKLKKNYKPAPAK